MNDQNRNTYMDQILEKQQKLEVDLKAKRHAPMQQQVAMAQPSEGTPPPGVARRSMRIQPVEQPAAERPVDVRITGYWRWKTVLVPPNAHVVHTRRGRTEPLTIGLGKSFKFDPVRDSYLVVPGAMQTILINAYSICRELQGLLLQGYVQWIIADFATAFRKLDFSDVEDPMRVVNVQLREQAEAAIKDKVATMGIDAVLSDKQPIIEELTARLRQVAEGGGGTDTGLGLRIVTVQIKEAVVSSSRLWENLQKPFRAERERVARLAELEAQSLLQARELEVNRIKETAQINSQSELATLRAAKSAEVFDRDQSEKLRRQATEQDAARKLAQQEVQTAIHLAELRKKRLAVEAEIQKLELTEQIAQAQQKTDGEIALSDAHAAARQREAKAALALEESRAKMENSISPGNLQARMISSLPEIANALPKPAELKSITIGPGGGEVAGLSSLVAQLFTVVDAVRPKTT